MALIDSSRSLNQNKVVKEKNDELTCEIQIGGESTSESAVTTAFAVSYTETSVNSNIFSIQILEMKKDLSGRPCNLSKFFFQIILIF